jgi:hypothetical protein
MSNSIHERPSRQEVETSFVRKALIGPHRSSQGRADTATAPWPRTDDQRNGLAEVRDAWIG